MERQLDGHDYLLGDFSQADIFFAPLLHYLSALPEGARIVAARRGLRRATRRAGRLQGDLAAAAAGT